MSCSEVKAKQELIETYFPNVEFTPEEIEALGTILLEINVRETQIKQLGRDLRDCADTLRYAARNCCRNPKQRAAMKRLCEFAKIACNEFKETVDGNS